MRFGMFEEFEFVESAFLWRVWGPGGFAPPSKGQLLLPLLNKWRAKYLCVHSAARRHRRHGQSELALSNSYGPCALRCSVLVATAAPRRFTSLFQNEPPQLTADIPLLNHKTCDTRYSQKKKTSNTAAGTFPGVRVKLIYSNDTVPNVTTRNLT